MTVYLHFCHTHVTEHGNICRQTSWPLEGCNPGPSAQVLGARRIALLEGSLEGQAQADIWSQKRHFANMQPDIAAHGRSPLGGFVSVSVLHTQVGTLNGTHIAMGEPLTKVLIAMSVGLSSPSHHGSPAARDHEIVVSKSTFAFISDTCRDSGPLSYSDHYSHDCLKKQARRNPRLFKSTASCKIRPNKHSAAEG